MFPEGINKFWEYFFRERRMLIKKMCDGQAGMAEFMLGFTRATPAIITCGPAGVNGSIKMVGPVPRKEYIEEYAEKAERYAYRERLDPKSAACVLYSEFYVEEKMDPLLIGGLEMGFNHTWRNLESSREATLLFYTPPVTSYEVRAEVEIITDKDNPYKRFLNAFHDIFHRPGKGRSDYPALIFKIKEIYDNSSTREGFGKRIYP